MSGTIRSKLLVGFVLIALLPLLSATVASIAIGIYSGQKQARERLESVALSREMAIHDWLASLQQELVIVSSTDCAHERISVVVNLAKENRFLHAYNVVVRKRLQSFVTQSQMLDELFLADLSGRVALSTYESHEGQDVQREGFFQEALEEPFASLSFHSQADVSSSPELPVLTVAMPIAEGDSQTLGVISGRVGVDMLDRLLHERTGLGESGKAYLLSPDQRLLAGSLPASDLPVSEAQLRITSAGIDSAVVGRTNGTATYDDYRGVRVIGVFRWLPEIRAMLFVEQDLSEAFGVIRTTLGTNLIVAVTALSVAVILAMRIMRGIAKPLENLSQTATEIAGGDLNRRARVEREDEIGTLAKAFNSMTAQVQGLVAELEERVADRTNQLQRAALQLETSARVSREVTSILSIDVLLARVTELIEGAFGYYAVHIYLLDTEANQLVFRASSSIPPHDLVLEIGPTSINGEVINTNRELLAHDVAQEPRFRADPNFPHIRSELVIPLRTGSSIIGTLDLLSAEPDAFQPQDVVIAQSLADQIAIAIENARLYERSQELAVLEERTRLARELHDAMNQSLYGIVLFAGAAHKAAEEAHIESTKRHLARVESAAQQALRDMRLMLYQLRPYSLGDKGLVGALQQRLETVEERAGIDVDLFVEGQTDLPAPVEETLYRIVQEALNNSLKHAAASKVRVSIQTTDHLLEIRVVDNGVGFDPTCLSPTAGMGMASMRERAAELGATLDISSVPGDGTRVSLVMDLEAQIPIVDQERGYQ